MPMFISSRVAVPGICGFSVTLYLFIAASVLILWFLEEPENGPVYDWKLRLPHVENMVLYLLYLYIYL